MSWVRIHDGALGHPKIAGIVELSHPFTLWVWGLSHSQMHLTDGIIVRETLPKRAWKTADELVRRKLWEEHPQGWMIHDFVKWNDSRETVEERKEEAKRRKEQWKARRNSDGTRSEHVPNANGTAVEHPPNQTKPNHVQEEKKEHTHSARARENFGRPTLIGNEHRAHAACGRICVPAFLHRQFKEAIGGAERDADTRLRNWYQHIFDQLSEDMPVPTDAGKFWRPLFDAEFVTEKPAVAVSLEAHVEGMREILRKQGHL